MNTRLFSRVNLVVAAFFALFVVVQYNDPDPLFWMIVYGLAALVCVLHHLKRLPPVVAAGYGVLVLVLGLYLVSRVISQGQFFFDEEGREMMGALLVFIWMAVLYGRGKRGEAIHPTGYTKEDAMSYLGFPRLHFAGSFTANPSTINNYPRNYGPATQQSGVVNVSWNAYGSASFTVEGAVESALDRSGNPVGSNDPILGATFKNDTETFGVTAKLVDLDTDEQTHTRFFGLYFTFTDADGNLLFSGLFDQPGCLKNLWFGRAPSATGDNVAGGTMQSIFPADAPTISGKNVNLTWGDISSSPFLQQLKAASPDGLSISFTGYGYQAHNLDPAFQIGTLVGAIGPYRQGAPKYKVARRMLSPVKGSSMWNAPAAVKTVKDASGSAKNLLSIDLSNAIPDQATGGPPIDQGAMWVALLPPGQTPILLGQYDYRNQFKQTGGMALIDVTGQHLDVPLAILTTQGPGTSIQTPQGAMHVTLRENEDGIYVTVDQSTVYMNPGDTASVDLYATKFGVPLPDYSVPLSLVPSSTNNDPADALSFPASVTTDSRGHASIPLTASDPSPKPDRRADINGQVYFVGGPWSQQFNANSQAPSAFTVKIFNRMTIPDAPTWVDDVGPILYQYYTLYAYMINFFDLSDYESVKGASAHIKKLINLPLSDPGLMPVTRELSRDEITIITKWIDQGCVAAPASA